MSLQPGKWTHIFASKIWEQTKLHSRLNALKFTLTLIRSVIRNSKGHVTNAAQTLLALCITSQQNHAMSCLNTLAGFSAQVTHKRKRQLKGFLREKIASELLERHSTASVWRNKQRKILCPTVIAFHQLCTIRRFCERLNRRNQKNNYNSTTRILCKI